MRLLLIICLALIGSVATAAPKKGLDRLTLDHHFTGEDRAYAFHAIASAIYHDRQSLVHLWINADTGHQGQAKIVGVIPSGSERGCRVIKVSIGINDLVEHTNIKSCFGNNGAWWIDDTWGLTVYPETISLPCRVQTIGITQRGGYREGGSKNICLIDGIWITGTS